MRIAIDARMYGPKAATGIGLYIKKLIEGLMDLDHNNTYDLLVNNQVASEIGKIPPNFKLIVVRSKWYSIGEQLELPLILYKNKYDLVHFPQFNVPLLYRRPFVVTIHDVTQYFYPGPSSKKNPIRRYAYRLILKNAVSFSRKIITVSNHTKQQITDHFGASASKIVVTYLGVDSIFKPSFDPSSANEFGEYILYVGVFRDHKNVDGLIRAFNIFKLTQPDAKLVLVGLLDERYPEVAREISASRYSSDIIVTGFVTDERLVRIFHYAKLFVLPSFCEGFGLVAIEAISSGVPVLASNTTSVPEILGSSGIYFDPKNTSEIASLMTRCWDDEDLRRKTLADAELIIAKYKWQNTVLQTLNIYQHS